MKRLAFEPIERSGQDRSKRHGQLGIELDCGPVNAPPNGLESIAQSLAFFGKANQPCSAVLAASRRDKTVVRHLGERLGDRRLADADPLRQFSDVGRAMGPEMLGHRKKARAEGNSKRIINALDVAIERRQQAPQQATQPNVVVRLIHLHKCLCKFARQRNIAFALSASMSRSFR